jgi:hypothetical protein
MASKTRSNKIEDSASPCLTPLVMGKVDVYIGYQLSRFPTVYHT